MYSHSRYTYETLENTEGPIKNGQPKKGGGVNSGARDA